MTTNRLDVQDIYGLVVASTFPLHQARPATGRTPDVLVSLGGRIGSTSDTPAGTVLLDQATGDDHWYSLVRAEDGSLVFRIYGLCDVLIAQDLDRAEFRMVDDVDEGMASILAVGTLCALLLTLRGRLVLHASAVEVDGAAIAFIGHSGMGKSTMAALMCADGARLLSDDVVPVDPADDVVTVPPGATEIRLRPGTVVTEEGLREQGVGERISADDRRILRFEGASSDAVPLAGIVVPLPTRDGRSEVVRLTGKEAMLALMSFPRLMGWSEPTVVGRAFTQAAGLVSKVPVYRAYVPWGPEAAPTTARLVREGVLQSAPI
ncbi:hypothetical protein [Isoptericola aurantiacus]|uniref:hypothetical protein n=1 Tax=Isoptericola aurantiacus TaxID=3377839 RepID=UPI00383AF04F